MNYEIHTVKAINLASGTIKLRQVINITKEQFEIIEMFANQTKDTDLNAIYKLNDCEFKIIPSLETGNKADKLSEELVQFTDWLIDSYEFEHNPHDVVEEYLSQEEFKNIF